MLAFDNYYSEYYGKYALNYDAVMQLQSWHYLQKAREGNHAHFAKEVVGRAVGIGLCLICYTCGGRKR